MLASVAREWPLLSASYSEWCHLQCVAILAAITLKVNSMASLKSRLQGLSGVLFAFIWA